MSGPELFQGESGAVTVRVDMTLDDADGAGRTAMKAVQPPGRMPA